MAFKNTLFGYAKESVDSAVSEYQLQLQQAHEEIDLLKRKLDETKSELMQAKSETERALLQNQRQVYELEYKLKDMTEKHHTAVVELTEQRQRKDGISQLYEYAYHSAANLSKSAYEGSKELVENTCSRLTQAQDRTRTFLEDIQSAGQQVRGLLQNLMEHVREMDEQVGLFTEKSDRFEETISSLEEMKQPIYDEFDRLMNEFESDAGRFLSETTRRETLSNPQSEEPRATAIPVYRSDFPNEPKPVSFNSSSDMTHSDSQEASSPTVPVSGNYMDPHATPEIKHNSMLEEQKRLLETSVSETQAEPVPQTPSPKTTEQLHRRLAVKDLLKKYSQLD